MWQLYHETWGFLIFVSPPEGCWLSSNTVIHLSKWFHTRGNADNSNSFWHHSDITNGTNIDILRIRITLFYIKFLHQIFKITNTSCQLFIDELVGANYFGIWFWKWKLMAGWRFWQTFSTSEFLVWVPPPQDSHWQMHKCHSWSKVNNPNDLGEGK